MTKPGALWNSPFRYAVWPGWRLLMQDAGIGTASVLRRARLPSDLFERGEVRLDSTSFFDLWRAIEAESASVDPALPAPLRIARVMSSDWFEPELFAALCSDSMASALERLATYVRLIAPMSVSVQRDRSQTIMSLDFADRSASPPAVFLAFKAIFYVQLARLGTRTRVTPLRVSWPWDSSRRPSPAYDDFFGVRVENSPLTTIVIGAADVERRFLTENHRMWQFFEPSLRKQVTELTHTAGMVDRVRGALVETLPTGGSSIQAVSRKLGVSTRTLQRRLREEGSSFQQTLDTVRVSLARHYLAQTPMSGGEISFLLGFDDANSFSRAFVAWTGKTVQAARSELRGSTPSSSRGPARAAEVPASGLSRGAAARLAEDAASGALDTAGGGGLGSQPRQASRTNEGQ